MSGGRIFINFDGKFYQAAEPKHPNDAETNFPHPNMLKALTEEPMTREEMLTKINHVDFDKPEADNG
jgi:hypothetical protein